MPLPGDCRHISRPPFPHADLYPLPDLTHVYKWGRLKGARPPGPFRNRHLGYSRGGLRDASPLLERADSRVLGVSKCDAERRLLLLIFPVGTSDDLGITPSYGGPT